MKENISLIILIILVTACSNHRKSKIIHPSRQNLALGENGHIINAEAKISQKKEDDRWFLPVLDSTRQISSIGKLQGDRTELFGFIGDTAIDSRWRIYLLDTHKQLIGVYNRDGSYITSIGGKGKGPGEFEFARSMANYNNKWLLVNNGYRIEIYSIELKKIKLLKTVKLDKRTYSICVCAGKLFVHFTGLMNQDNEDEIKMNKNVNMIQAFALPSFEPLFSFGRAYKSTYPMVVDRLSEGDISCNEASSTVMFTFAHMPVVEGYSAKDGHHKWKTRVDGLHFPEIIQQNKGEQLGALEYTPPKDIMDRFIPSVTFDGNYEILQVRRQTFHKDKFGSREEGLTFLLDSVTGEGSLVSKKLPFIYNASHHLAVTVSDDYITSKIYKF
ncbi:6-bladed beta-propeller [Aliifodinibius sp. S!AR15-10]|uniref:6-bladed beta-propeller n=1 Tax=Aliifodinibius sp. S!AR15-10 TaxID=2950437 RepID=UPI002855B66B|nr:6-bladed beta-propeller [Aliifodinibius sp. S!AR15-10]MDR8391269.1 6-bladed beta-propeller [Aliifodinibius sp. S!AR15-10]